MRYQDQVVWITGASSGIGEAMAYAFSREGARLILSARRAESLQAVASRCAEPDKVRILPLDVAALESLEGKVQEALAFFGQVDVMVHNAGISQRSLVKDTPLSVHQRVMDTNFFGPVALTRALLPHMLERHQGHFVVTSSLVGIFSTRLRSSYAASKHALHGFFDALRLETWRDGLKVTLICPGFVRTEVARNAVTADGSPQGHNDATHEKAMLPEVFAAKALKAIAAGKEEVYIGGWELVGIYLKHMIPPLFRYLVKRSKTA